MRFLRIHDWRIGTKAVVLALGPALVVSGTIAFVVLPGATDSLYDERRHGLQSLTAMTYSLLDEYNARVVSGELSLEEAQQRAIGRIKHLRHDTYGYFWIMDLTPVMIMHPFRPDLDGTDVGGFTDEHGKKLFAECVARCREDGEGFVDYYWPKPGESRQQLKLSYVRLFQPWGWVVGTGMYMDDVESQLADIRLKMLLTIVTIGVLVCLLAYGASRFITTPIGSLAKNAWQVANGNLDIQVDHGSRDELGLLSSAFGVMVGNLRKMFDEVTAARAAVEDGERQYRSLFEVHPQPMWVVNKQKDEIVAVNDSAVSFYGYSREEFLSKRLHEVVVSGPASGSHTAQHRRKDGTKADVETTPCALTQDDRHLCLELLVDVSERQRATEQLRKLSQAIDQLPVGIMIVDLEGRVEYINPAFALMTGFTLSEVVGKDPREVLRGEFVSDVYSNIVETLRSGHLWHGEVRNRKKNGETYWESVSLGPIRNEEGRVSHFVGIHTDIGNLKRTNEQLERSTMVAEEQARTLELQAEELKVANARAVEASRLKSEFLANMSHEMRTPMNGVIGMADYLMESDLSDTDRDCVDTIRKSGEALLRVINQILDLAKIESGTLDLENTEFDVQRVLSDVVDILGTEAKRKGISLEVSVADSVPAKLIGDPGAFSQVLTNLLGNAIKFTKEGAVRTDVSARVSAEQDIRIQVSVTDTGIGMSAEQSSRIFEPFVQADGSTRRRYGGTGLGLAISSRLVGLMGGEIGVKSTAGKGSTFWFSVPFGKPR